MFSPQFQQLSNLISKKDFFYPRLGWQDHQRPRVPELGEHVAAVAAASCLLLMLTVG